MRPTSASLPADPRVAADASVFGTLARGSHAMLERVADLGDGITAAIWRNEHAEARYIKPGHHTLSVYLQGGYTTHRQDLPHVFGAPGRVCMLPAEHESAWVIKQPMRLVHLYFAPEALAGHAVRLLDAEPRLFTLHDRTFIEDPHLAHWCTRIAQLDWTDLDDRMRANALASDTLSYLVRTQGRTRALPVRGGLAPHVCRRIAAMIDAGLHLPLSIGMLAREANLSEFHFARMFRVSFGVAPHEWVMQRRLARACELLRHSALPLAAVADRCGFAGPAHFSRRFAVHAGASPSRYRQAWQGDPHAATDSLTRPHPGDPHACTAPRL
ncbi:helix-turn-helix domain-containing protein [Ralstonia solanacearum]|uniref:helix-turn-helix domain-containing protein n=1 Tax=Ralstonia solanacearum TaxID=305 RepID=UPI000181733A|nr:AraC family transcriptional regulator [Ralstonia solanacearum]MDC6176704.1 AraC family transcriptional regulator [Ralstonia solanacearum]MDC6210076.1 AraC family transcriptional regulator [Ralstonia solanacearum]MDC6238210.1 AraC family transcriptional regulator [Ralstonia solanacearum]MDD7800047.1 AraC family transcriptional regulator [Ralstonia solanacearum]